ncbi:MAG: exosome complex protein Rrp4 [Nanoarchaeota archaeon]|nr:exosome complex protein Rrp4 [Nanoarchaeota archaeon]MBU1644054.1 exosome complex protein Rrp4 [Nanoarchaeota archaeon]MBU1977296.1 exosome complex protein Rrp4 [Nanoarchaeota archaeon]
MSSILVQDKSVVVPGEILAEGMDYLPGDNTYRENDKIYSKVLGLGYPAGRVIKVTPLAGPYVPKPGDKIIGKIIDIAFSGWRVNTSTAYSAMMNVKDATSRFIKKEEDLSKIMAIGDHVVVKITNVTSQNLIDLTMKEPGLYKISGGRLITIDSQKVPRVIGKKGSMISQIKEKTGCNITVGQNGVIWLKGSPEGELLAEKAIKLIEQRSHQEGLTDKIEKFLEENKVPLPERKSNGSDLKESEGNEYAEETEEGGQ